MAPDVATMGLLGFAPTTIRPLSSCQLGDAVEGAISLYFRNQIRQPHGIKPIGAPSNL